MAKEKQEKIMQSILAGLVCIILIFSNLFLVFETLSWGAQNDLELQNVVTSNSNVLFDAYFDSGGQKVHSNVLDINMSCDLIFHLKTKKNLSLEYSKIKIDNANFKLDVANSPYIKNYDENTNTLELNPLSTNEEVFISVPIYFDKQYERDISNFARYVECVFESSVLDDNQNIMYANSTIEIFVGFTQDISYDVINNFKYVYSFEDKYYLVEEVELNYESMILPRKEEQISISKPEIENCNLEIESVVLNGKKLEQYEVEDNKLKLTNQITTNSTNSIIQVVYNLELEDNTQKQVICQNNILTNVLFLNYESYEQKEIYTNQEVGFNGSIFNIDTCITNDIYDGYFKYGKSEIPQTITEKNVVDIYMAKDMKNIKINTNDYTFLVDDQYKNVEIYSYQLLANKTKLEKTLGKDFSINLYDENDLLITNISDKNADESGNIEISFEDTKYLTIEIENVENEGQFEYELKKKIYPGINVESININSKISTNNMDKIASCNYEYNLKKSTTQAQIDTNITDIVNSIDNDLVINTVLNSKDYSNVIYQEPIIDYVFPSEISSIELKDININQIFEIESCNINNNHLIVVLKGNQESYLSSLENEINLNIKLNVKLDDKALSKNEVLKTNILNNKNGEIKEYANQINLINNNKLIIQTAIDENKTTKQNEIFETELEKYKEQKVTKIQYEILSNNYGEYEDKVIMGNIGTDSKIKINNKEYISNLGASLVEPIKTNIENAKIYYTENENANSSLEDVSNGWMEVIPSYFGVKKYLIVTNIKYNEPITIEYMLNIKENLDYNMSCYAALEIEGEATSSIINLNTGKTVKLVQDISLEKANQELTSSSVITSNDVLTLNIDVQNIGDLNLDNAKLEFDSTYYDIKYINQENEITYDENKASFDLGGFNARDSKNIVMHIKAKENISNESILSSCVSLIYGDSVVKDDITSVMLKNSNSSSLSLNHMDFNEFTGGNNDHVLYTNGSILNTIILVSNNTGIEYKNVEISVNDDQCKLESIRTFEPLDEEHYIETELGTQTEILKEYTAQDGKIIIDKIPTTPGFQIRLATRVIGNAKNDEVLVTPVITIDNEQSTLESCAYYITDYYEEIDFNLSSNKENEVVKTDDKIDFEVELKSQNKYTLDSHIYEVSSSIPKELEVTNVYINNQEIPIQKDIASIENQEEIGNLEKEEVAIVNVPYARYEDSNLQIYVDVQKEKEYYIKIETKVRQNGNIQDKKMIETKFELAYALGVSTLSSNLIKNYVQRYQDENVIFSTGELSSIELNAENNKFDGNDNNLDNSNTGDDQIIQGSSNINVQNTNNYSISGTAFIDSNLDGIFNNEKTLANVQIKLLNSNNQVLKTANTQQNGIYSFASIPEGTYKLVATLPEEYDFSKISQDEYANKFSSQNSDSSTLTISLNSNKVMNIGVIKKTSFIPQIEKYIKKISVINSDGIFNYTYDNIKMAKIEVNGNNLENTQAIITYTIKITNTGDKEGYIQKIEDILPSDLELKTELNKDWKIENNVAINESISKEVIKPGQTKEIELVCSKELQKENLGTISNSAKIKPLNNDGGTLDANAKIIIGIKSGEVNYLIYISMITIILIISYMVYVNKVDIKIARKEKKKWKEIIQKK